MASRFTPFDVLLASTVRQLLYLVVLQKRVNELQPRLQNARLVQDRDLVENLLDDVSDFDVHLSLRLSFRSTLAKFWSYSTT